MDECLYALLLFYVWLGGELSYHLCFCEPLHQLLWFQKGRVVTLYQ